MLMLRITQKKLLKWQLNSPIQVLPDEYINNADPGKYALLGAAAMLGGVVRFFENFSRN